MDKLIAELRTFMKENDVTSTYVANEIDISKTALSQWMSKTYNGDNEKITDRVSNFLRREKLRSTALKLPIVDISTMMYIKEVAALCHTRGRIGVCVGSAGLGKTVAAKEYVKKYIDAILIESDYSYTARSLLLELHKALGLSCKGCVYNLMEEVVEKLQNSGRLIIIDEAENLRREALEMTRRIHDKTGVGLLLIGREVLLQNLRGRQNQYDQLYSRVMYKKHLGNLAMNDVITIVAKSGLSTDLAKTFYGCCKGNTRRLEHLICNSIVVAQINDREEVDESIVKETSKMLMDKE